MKQTHLHSIQFDHMCIADKLEIPNPVTNEMKAFDKINQQRHQYRNFYYVNHIVPYQNYNKNFFLGFYVGMIIKVSPIWVRSQIAF